MTTAEHTHSWAADNGLAGIACRDCHTSGWDWQQDEIKRLKDELASAEHDRDLAMNLEYMHSLRADEQLDRLRGELALWQQRFGDAQATLSKQQARAHTVDDGDGVCGDCLWCEENTGADCNVPADPKCAWCGHCLGNHSEHANPEVAG